LAQPDGHDFPRTVDERIPSVAAVIDDIVVGFEDAVREPVVAHILPDIFDRVEFSSGHFGGSGIMVMLAGMNNPADRCHPA
jgi:hypothetical protein